MSGQSYDGSITPTFPEKGLTDRALRFWSFVLPIIKCAVCPACLSMLGGVFSGVRMGFLGDERFHGWVLAAALIFDFVILRAAMRHHKSRLPLVLCASGGAVAVAGHFTNEFVELSGFGLLMLAALQNALLLRRHHRAEGSCCAHGHAVHLQEGHRERA